MSLLSKLSKMTDAERAAFLAESADAAKKLADERAAAETKKAQTRAAYDAEKAQIDATYKAATDTAREARDASMAALAERFGNLGSPTAGTVVPPKYRHPNNHNLVWSGRGIPAKWVTEIGMDNAVVIATGKTVGETRATTATA